MNGDQALDEQCLRMETATAIIKELTEWMKGDEVCGDLDFVIHYLEKKVYHTMIDKFSVDPYLVKMYYKNDDTNLDILSKKLSDTLAKETAESWNEKYSKYKE